MPRGGARGRREAMGKGVVHAAVLEGHAVGLGVGGVRQEQCPRRAGPGRRVDPAIERPHPRRERIGVVATGGERPRVQPVHRAPGPPDRKDRRPVLARDGQHAGAGVAREHPVVQRGAAEPAWRRADLVARAQHGRVGILYAPGVEGDSGVGGVAAGQHRGVPRCGLGGRVVLLAVLEHRPAPIDAREAAGPLRRVAGQVVGPHLIDRDQYHERGAAGRAGHGRRCLTGERPRPGQARHQGERRSRTHTSCRNRPCGRSTRAAR